jgi:hypothetical protein
VSATKHLLPPWQPGRSANPGGRPRIPDNLRGILSLSQTEVCKLISRYARMSKDEIFVAITDPKTSVLEMSIAAVFIKAIDKSDFTALAFLLDRAIGRAPTLVETDEDIAARKELQELSDSELIRLAEENLPKLKAIESK